MPHHTSPGRTTPRPARSAAVRTGREVQAHAGHSGRTGRAPSGRRAARVLEEGAPGGGPRGTARSAGRPPSAEPQPLQHVVEDAGPLPAAQLRKVAARTATALAAKHRAGIVHRGLHPGSVLLGPGGAKVIGFGAADAAPDAGPAGKAAYMAPEQIEDEPVGPPADVFAWGATMVFAATGRPPFGGGPGAAVTRRVTAGRPDLGDMRGPLRDLAARCLDKNPAARPTAPQIVRALREGQGPMAKPRPTRIPRYRWRMMVALAAVVVSGFVLGMLF